VRLAKSRPTQSHRLTAAALRPVCDTRTPSASAENSYSIIANILFNLEKEGYLKYQVEPRLPFDDGRGRWADFLIEANGES
jgi:hypothetical protein